MGRWGPSLRHAKHQTKQGVEDDVCDVESPSLDLQLCFVDKSDNSLFA